MSHISHINHVRWNTANIIHSFVSYSPLFFVPLDCAVSRTGAILPFGTSAASQCAPVCVRGCCWLVPIAGRSEGPWRRVILHRWALVSWGRRCMVRCLMLRDHQKLGYDWCVCHLARLLWTWGWVWPLLLCRSLRHFSSLSSPVPTWKMSGQNNKQSLPGCGTKE